MHDKLRLISIQKPVNAINQYTIQSTDSTHDIDDNQTVLL